MVSRAGVPLQSDETLEILVFTVGGVCCGIDGELVGRMRRLEEAERGGETVYRLEKLLAFGGREVAYRNPLVVALPGLAGEAGLVIEQPRDLVKVPLAAICPLPAFFERCAGLRVFWGGLVLEGKIVLLLDPGRLAAMHPVQPECAAGGGS